MFSRVSLEAITLTALSLLVGVVLAIISLNLIFDTGLADQLKTNQLHELFARIAIVVALIGFAFALYRTPNIPKRTDHGLRVPLILAIYGAGVFIALMDPFSQIRNELNLIRYPTAIVLTIAGILLVRTAIFGQRHFVLSLLGGALGVLLVLAAGDELLELHERITIADDSYFKEATGISSQDLSTLFVAMTGIIVAFVARRIVRALANRKLFGAGDREIAASDLFLAAGIAFLAAMLLDTFDSVFTGSARALLSPLMLESNPLMIGQELNQYFETLANSIEEFLEFAAAVLLLSTALVYSAENNQTSQ